MDDDPAEDGIDWVELECHDFDRFRQAVSDHLEPAGWGSRFPVLLRHRNSLGNWSAAAATELEAELLVIQDELADVPATTSGAGGRPDAADAMSILDTFVTADGDRLVERLIDLARTAQEEDREITFQ